MRANSSFKERRFGKRKPSTPVRGGREILKKERALLDGLFTSGGKKQTSFSARDLDLGKDPSDRTILKEKSALLSSRMRKCLLRRLYSG